MNPRNDRHRNLYEDPLACLIWWWDLMILGLMFPSNSVIVFLRKNLGYRLMRPWIFGAIFLFLAFTGFGGFVSFILSGGATGGIETGGGSMPLLIYALALAVLAFIHRRRGWKLVLRKDDPVHTMSRGDSYLAMLLPFIPEWVIQRYVEPLLLLALGYYLARLQWTVLGLWLMLSSACLAGIESVVLEHSINAMLDPLDDKIEAKMMQAMDAAIEGKGQLARNQKVGGLVVASPELMRLRAERLNPEAKPPAWWASASIETTK